MGADPRPRARPWRRLCDWLLDFVFPPLCGHCGRVDFRFCDACCSELAGLPLESAPRGIAHIQRFCATGKHGGILASAVRSFKYDGAIELAQPLAARLLAAWGRLHWPVDCIVPVPLFADRLRERGYNQSYLLCQQLAPALGLPSRSDYLERVRSTSQQARLNSAARWLNVQDAFAASHRAHASIVGVPRHLPSYFGHTFVAEYEALRQAHEPVSPSLFILGGAKFDTKIPLVEKMLKTYDQVFIGGALANDIYKARGYEVGKSLVSDISLTGHQLLASDKVTVPTDVIVDGLNGQRTCGAGAVTADECILDAGPTTATALGAIIAKAKTIVWNGPLGNYEAGYSQQTEAVARLIAQASGHSLVGGGDTVAAIEALGVRDGIDFVSTGGGAMLTFLEAGTLPAIEAVVISNA